MIKKINTMNTVLKREGVFGFVKLARVKFLCGLYGLLAVPFFLIILLFYPILRIRLIPLFSFRIGHYALNAELFLCAFDSKVYDKNKRILTLFYTLTEGPICNSQLHKMWKRCVPILPFPAICIQLDRFLCLFFGEKYKDNLKEYFGSTIGSYDRWGYLERPRSHLSFTLIEKKKARIMMEKFGVPIDASFVCILGRDALYLEKQLPGRDYSHHDYRNVDINTYRESALFLAEQGYYVFRMGKYVKSAFDVDHPRIIDYANHPLRSDFMDIYLVSHCYFMMSCSSGMDSVAQLFRRPLLITNICLPDIRGFYFWKIFIPKKIIDSRTKKLIPFKEVYKVFIDAPLGRVIDTLKKYGWELVDNSPEEILEATKEMLALLSCSDEASCKPHELQEKFWKEFHDNVIEPLPIFNPEGAEVKSKKIRVGTAFLEKYRDLISS
ncbi:MAG: TIGR04372 family glycosyltransferase [Gammaproteobacteria bacterium]|nr:TIGR04372 family glycosyltransferase [Gammaproteobacteria bacterium]